MRCGWRPPSDRHRARPPRHLRRLSVGAARLQPGARAARRAVRLSHRCVRRLVPCRDGASDAARVARGILGRTVDGCRLARRRSSWPASCSGDRRDCRRISSSPAGGHCASASCRATSRRTTSGSQRSAREIFERYVRLTKTTIEQGAPLRALARVATPFYFGAPEPGDRRAADARAGRRARRCSSAATCGRRRRPARRRDIYNAAFMLKGRRDAGRRLIARCTWCRSASTCRCSRLLFFAAPLVEAVSNLLAGPTGEHAAVSVTPPSPRRSATRSSIRISSGEAAFSRASELLTTITNDAWFGRRRRRRGSTSTWRRCGRSSRAGISCARPTPGSSGVVDPHGRVLMASDLLVEGAWTADVRLLTG